MSVIFLQTEKLQDKNRSELTKIGLPLGGGFTTHVQGGLPCIASVVSLMCNGCATVACSALLASTTRSAALDLGKNLKQQRGGRDMQGPQGRMNTGNQIQTVQV